jgi:hypothetical protein
MDKNVVDESDLEATEAAHDTLMSAYARVWDELSPTQSGVDLGRRLNVGEHSVVLALVRYFVASHTSRQLRELRAVYVRLQHLTTVPAFSIRKGQVWLREAAADVSAFVEALPRRDWQWDVFLTALTLIPGSVFVWLFSGQWTVEAESFVKMVVGAAIGVASAMAFTAVHASFEAKRRLFGAPADRHHTVHAQSGQRENIYEHEQMLFRRLAWPKREELPVDFIVSIATQVVVAAVSLVTAINGFRSRFVAGGIVFVVVSSLLLVSVRRTARRVRERSPR